MAKVQATKSISHFGIAPAAQSATHLSPGVGGGTPTLLTTPGRNASITIGTKVIPIDVSQHTPGSIVDLINNAGAQGVTATLDRHGRLVVDGVAVVGGDATLLASLGLV